MRSALLLNNIKVGNFDVDDMSGIIIPYLKTFIEGDGYTVLMTEYSFNFQNECIIVKYLLSTYPEDCNGDQIEFIFNTLDINFDEEGQPFETHYMQQI